MFDDERIKRTRESKRNFGKRVYFRNGKSVRIRPEVGVAVYKEGDDERSEASRRQS